MVAFGPKSTLDMKYYYTPIEARHFFQGLSDGQARLYLLNELADLCFLSTYSALAFQISKRVFGATSKLKWLAFTAGLFDLIETGTIICLLASGRSLQAPFWLGISTCLKWTTGGAGVLFLVFTALTKGKSRHATRQSS
jgi:hypothetical protein